MASRVLPLCSFSSTLVPYTQLFSLLTVPYFVALHRDQFDTSAWGVWLRVFTFGFTTVLGLGGFVATMGSNKYLRRGVAGGLAVGAAATMYNVLFGLRTAQVIACSGDSRDACMEPAYLLCSVLPTQTLGSVRPWQALLFSFSLCGLLCSQAISIAILMSESMSTVSFADGTTPDSLNQSAWEATSLTHDNSPGKKGVKVDTLEKSGLIEPVFIPSKRNPPPGNPAAGPESLSLTNTGEFTSSLGRGRGRGRGR